MFQTEIETKEIYIKLSEWFIESCTKAKDRSEFWTNHFSESIEQIQSEMPTTGQMSDGAWYEFDVISETEDNVMLGAGRPIAMVLNARIKKMAKLSKIV